MKRSLGPLTALLTCVAVATTSSVCFGGIAELLATAKDAEADFDSALATEVEAGLPQADQLEAKIVRSLVTGDFDGLIGYVPEIDARASAFTFGFDRSFMSERQLRGFADTLRSIQAYQDADYEAFDRYVASAFVNAPDYTKAFGLGELVTRLRTDEAREILMANFVVPMDLTLASVEGEAKSLRDWVGDNKAILIDFWASWCGPCIQLMPGLRAKSDHLSDQGIFVAGVNTDKTDDQLEKANTVRAQRDMASVPWLLDTDGEKLSGLLQIDSIPRMVLINPEGKVLFNGHPNDPQLAVVLATLDVSLPEVAKL